MQDTSATSAGPVPRPPELPGQGWQLRDSGFVAFGHSLLVWNPEAISWLYLVLPRSPKYSSEQVYPLLLLTP